MKGATRIQPKRNSTDEQHHRRGSDDSYGGVHVTPVGLHIPTELPYTLWEKAGFRISAVANSSTWCLGDWLVYGQSRYTDRYRKAIDAIGLDYQTLRNYAWVSRRVELSRRRDGLSFQHHAEVAALPPEEQDYWLDQAQQNKWPRNQLRQNLAASRREKSDDRREQVSLELKLTADRIARYQEVAGHSKISLESWIVEQLDTAAAAFLD
ncbi:LmbU family transcriptional regulator [Streptosporangium sp. NPDC051023]|uniref:LmbU family transcriptional regulator n=1 Tax=Streptosporangium sp. NPDC051023 TaxID=3155410 RepID=UPI00344D97A8